MSAGCFDAHAAHPARGSEERVATNWGVTQRAVRLPESGRSSRTGPAVATMAVASKPAGSFGIGFSSTAALRPGHFVGHLPSPFSNPPMTRCWLPAPSVDRGSDSRGPRNRTAFPSSRHTPGCQASFRTTRTCARIETWFHRTSKTLPFSLNCLLAKGRLREP